MLLAAAPAHAFSALLAVCRVLELQNAPPKRPGERRYRDLAAAAAQATRSGGYKAATGVAVHACCACTQSTPAVCCRRRCRRRRRRRHSHPAALCRSPGKPARHVGALEHTLFHDRGAGAVWVRGRTSVACLGAAWDAPNTRVQPPAACAPPCCRIDLQLAQDPNSSNLGTTVWDASMVLAKYIEKASDPAPDIQRFSPPPARAAEGGVLPKPGALTFTSTSCCMCRIAGAATSAGTRSGASKRWSWVPAWAWRGWRWRC